jgi:hypothetical protein
LDKIINQSQINFDIMTKASQVSWTISKNNLQVDAKSTIRLTVKRQWAWHPPSLFHFPQCPETQVEVVVEEEVAVVSLLVVSPMLLLWLPSQLKIFSFERMGKSSMMGP